MSDKLTVDDIVTGKVAETLGEGVIPTAAILVVETMSEEGNGMRYVMSKDAKTWHVMGMLRAAQLKIEHDDLAGWLGEEDED